jgi:hypothetical protein
MAAAAKVRASANPMPLAPPVTNAVLPASSRMFPLLPGGIPAEHGYPQVA